LGFGVGVLGPNPKPQIPNPQSPIPNLDVQIRLKNRENINLKIR